MLTHRNPEVKRGKTPQGEQASLGSIIQNKHQYVQQLLLGTRVNKHLQ